MTPALDGVVPPPHTDRPALADPTTAALFAFMRKQVVGAVTLVWTVVAVVVLAGLMALASTYSDVVVLLALAAAMLVEGCVVGTGLAARRWRPALDRLGWQQAAVTVLDDRGTVLRLADGRRVRVWGPVPAVRDVIARAGHVWLVDPDSRGWTAVRAPGVHLPWPARIVTGSGGHPVAGADTDELRQLGRVQLSSLLAWAGMAVVTILVLVIGSPLLEACVLTAGLGVGIALYRGVCLLRYRQLAALRRGPWQRLSATVTFGAVKRNATADATGTVQLPSGERFALVMKNADVNVLANIEKTGSVWVAGAPLAGKDHALGFPGYPLIAKARLDGPQAAGAGSETVGGQV